MGVSDVDEDERERDGLAVAGDETLYALRLEDDGG